MKTNSFKSLLFVPAKAKMLAKLATMGECAYILDLEDSIVPDDKAQALKRVSDFLSEHYSNKGYVRINADNSEAELNELAKYETGFVLPKFENPEYYERSLDILKEHDVIALVETPLGVVNIERIAKTQWIDAIAFGAEDYTAAVNMENKIDFLQYQKSRLVTYAKAYNKFVYDTPSFKLDDVNEFKREVDNAVALGFDGKMAISPKHLAYINESFRRYDLAFIKSVTEQFEASGLGVLVIEGHIYEKPHIERLKRILREHNN